MGRLIDADVLIECLKGCTCTDKHDEKIIKDFVVHIINEQPTVKTKVNKWIPFETREADQEEKEEYGWEAVLCCKLPEEDEEILVSYASEIVEADIFMRDGTECYLESGAEFMTEAIAWMPFPDPYIEKPDFLKKEFNMPDTAAVGRETWKDAVMRHFEKVE